jgi:4-amino-4-deoxy-L-arabinose transferase-like glycosyltransferase
MARVDRLTDRGAALGSAYPGLSSIEGASAAHASAADTRPVRIAIAAIAVGAVVRLALAAWLPLFPDETYYWEWSRHLAAGYFDHPPGIAWAIRLGTMTIGVSPLGVRLGPWLAGTLASAATVWIGHSLGGRRTAMWTAVVVACLPVAALGLVLATPDAMLVAGMALTLACVVRAVAESPASNTALGWWLAAGASLGAAMLAKYPAVFLAAGVFIGIVVRPELRAHLRRPGPYLAAALAVAIIAPMVWWNARHDWVSFRFQLHHGLATSEAATPIVSQVVTALRHESEYVGSMVLFASPILFGLAAAAIVRALRRNAPPAATLLAVASVTWIFAFAASALRHSAEPNWSAPALLAAAPLIGWAVTDGWAKRWAVAGCALALAMLIAVVGLAAHPLAFVAPARDPVARAYGWDALGARVAALGAVDPRDVERGRRVWVAGNRYQDASELAFHMPSHPRVFALNVASRANQYDLWESFAAHARAGDDLVFVVDDNPGSAVVVDSVAAHFERRGGMERVALRRSPPPAEPIAWRQVWLLVGWRGAPNATARY